LLTSNDRTVIKGCALFEALDPQDLAQLVDSSSIMKISRNLQLFEQGELAKALFLIVDGQIKLTRLAPDGNEAVVHIFGPGEVFAEAAMFMGGCYPVTATAISDARLIAISSERLRQQVQVKPAIAFAMLASMAQHLKVLVGQIEQMKLMTTKQRTIRFLLDQAGKTEGSAAFTLPYDKSLIASTLGMKPETFSRVVAQLSPHGLDVTGASVRIEDIGRLRGLLSFE
jgi:CRP-like cAMP-binding protein